MATSTIPAGSAASAALNAYAGGPAPGLNNIIVHGWILEGSTRGTWSLLYSCAFTIGICVWTALHPNVRAHGEGRWHPLGRKLNYMGIAVLAPEAVVTNALIQLRQARYLRKKLNEAKGEEEQRYSLVFCYYLMMGGFVTDVSSIHDGKSFMVLLPRTVQEIQKAGKGYLFALSDKTISDRSKADVLAKGLAVCQILWVAVQSISRVQAGLTLTLLEIHTMVQIIAAIIMYASWWYKPKDVETTTMIDFQSIEPELRKLLAISSPEASAPNGLEGEYLTNRAHDGDIFPNELGASNQLLVLLVASLLCILDVAVHMTVSAQWGAKGHYFPTDGEAMAWNVTCYLVLGAVPFFWIYVICFVLRVRVAPETTEKSLVLAAFCIMWLIFLSKVYIVLESFISIRAVPLAAYAVPNWALYIPHI